MTAFGKTDSKETPLWKCRLRWFFRQTTVEITIGVIIVLSVILTMIEISLPESSPLIDLFDKVNWAITLLFTVELTLRLLGAQRKRAFFREYWLDIIALRAVCPVRFVAKEGVRGWPVFGTLAQLIGTLFTQRRQGRGLGDTVGAVSGALGDGCSVAVFPEATTSDGVSVGRFHAALFEAACQVRCLVQPVTIVYQEAGRTRPLAPFVDDDALLPHLWRLLGCPVLYVTLVFGRPMAAAYSDRRRLAESCRRQVRGVLHRHRPPSTRAPLGRLPAGIGATHGPVTRSLGRAGRVAFSSIERARPIRATPKSLADS